MTIVSEADWLGMKAVGQVVHLTLKAVEKAVREGVRTSELDELAAAIFAQHGARSAPALTYDFPGTILISVNNEIVHGIPGDDLLHAGDVVKIDVTAEKDGYIADAARTVIVGEGTTTAQKLKQCVEQAFAAAMAVTKVGTPVNEIGRAIWNEVRRHGFQVIPHLTGHGVGRAIHEEPTVPNFYNKRQRDILTEGLVLAVEPIVCAGNGKVFTDDDGWTICTQDQSLAAHYENTIVVTQDGPVILTAAS